MQCLTVMRRAKLTPAELAIILKISRVSVYNWIAGRSKPHILLESRLEKTTALLNALLDRGKLPFADNLDKNDRKAKVLKIKGLVATIRSS